MKFGKDVFKRELYGTDDKVHWMEEWDKQKYIKREDGELSNINQQLIEVDIFWSLDKYKPTGMSDYAANLRDINKTNDEDVKKLYKALDILAHIRHLLTDNVDINQLLCRYQDDCTGVYMQKINKLLVDINAKALECREIVCSIASNRSDLFNIKDYTIFMNHIKELGYVGNKLPVFISVVQRLMAKYSVEGEVFYGNKEIDNKILFIPLLDVLVETNFNKISALDFRVKMVNAMMKNVKYSEFLYNISYNAAVLNAFIKYSFKVYKEIVNLKASILLKIILEINNNTNFMEKL